MNRCTVSLAVRTSVCSLETDFMTDWAKTALGQQHRQSYPLQAPHLQREGDHGHDDYTEY